MTQKVLTKCAVVVLYKPQRSDIDNLQRVATFFDELVVVDNSPVPCSIDGLESSTIQVHCNLNRGGIAGAFNYALDHSKINPDLFFLLDQDSRITSECVDQLHLSAQELGDTPFIVGPAIFDMNLEKYSPLLRLSKWAYHATEIDLVTPGRHRVFSVISSGSAISRRALQILRHFDEGLFIDHVDTEYALRAAKHDVPVYVDTRAVLQHAIGQRTENRFLGLRLRPNNHPPFRRYYIFRNGLILALRHLFLYPSFFILNNARMVHELLCILLYERKRPQKIGAIILGILDGLLMRSGTFGQRWPKVSKKL
ncbi:hypothetical protein [Ralstonia pickettii]|uniref:hypothetical protein n=1 Tax=Ralstonia pickettii TaxID=329 RepID=UPI0015BD178A|nr:hypothetical protein [Ralstonia pickettii]NWK43820.1 hypothetical protein [Ralstonia pickettii]